MDEDAIKGVLAGHDLLYDAGLVDRRADLLAALGDARALIVRNRTQVNGELLARAPRLQAVGRLGVGLDNIDMAACKARGDRRLSGDRRQRYFGGGICRGDDADAAARRLWRDAGGDRRQMAAHGIDRRTRSERQTAWHRRLRRHRPQGRRGCRRARHDGLRARSADCGRRSSVVAAVGQGDAARSRYIAAKKAMSCRCTCRSPARPATCSTARPSRA